MTESIRFEIAWVSAGCAQRWAHTLSAGACVADALRAFAHACPAAAENLDACQVGVFGRVAPRERLLHDGDRVEIYRPLQNDPKTARRDRARQAARRR